MLRRCLERENTGEIHPQVKNKMLMEGFNMNLAGNNTYHKQFSTERNSTLNIYKQSVNKP